MTLPCRSCSIEAAVDQTAMGLSVNVTLSDTSVVHSIALAPAGTLTLTRDLGQRERGGAAAQTHSAASRADGKRASSQSSCHPCPKVRRPVWVR